MIKKIKQEKGKQKRKPEYIKNGGKKKRTGMNYEKETYERKKEMMEEEKIY